MVTVQFANNDTAVFTHDSGIFEIELPPWSGWLTRRKAIRMIADLRRFCDEADAALSQTDQQPKEESK